MTDDAREKAREAAWAAYIGCDLDKKPFAVGFDAGWDAARVEGTTATEASEAQISIQAADPRAVQDFGGEPEGMDS